MAESPLKLGFNVPFSEAIKAAQQRNVVLPDVYYGELQGLARQQAFSVAGLASLDQLTIVRNSLAAKLQSGQTFRQWQKDITESGTLDLPRHRLDNIFRTNIQSNYNRGRWERFVEGKDTQPYLMYDAINDSRVRPSHLAMDGIIRTVDDPFWHSHAPLNGYRCRCRLVSLNERLAQARSGNGTGLNKGVDAQAMQPDKGFDYNPGEDLMVGIKRGIASRATTAPAKLVKALDEKLASQPTYWQAGTQQAPWHDASFTKSPDWIKQVIKNNDGDFKGLLPFNPAKGAYHERGSIHMAKEDIKTYGGQGTWRHEYGHYLDRALSENKISYRSMMPDFTQAMRDDTKVIINESGFGKKSKKYDDFILKRNEKYKAIQDEIVSLGKDERKLYLTSKAKKIGLTLEDIESFFVKETVHVDDIIARDARIGRIIESIASKDAVAFMESIKTYDAMDRVMFEKGLTGQFSDIVGSATKNKLLGHGPFGGHGHSDNYYKKRAGYGQQTEIFANMTSLLSSNSKFWEITTESFYPTLTALYKDILK